MDKAVLFAASKELGRVVSRFDDVYQRRMLRVYVRARLVYFLTEMGRRSIRLL